MGPGHDEQHAMAVVAAPWSSVASGPSSPCGAASRQVEAGLHKCESFLETDTLCSPTRFTHSRGTSSSATFPLLDDSHYHGPLDDGESTTSFLLSSRDSATSTAGSAAVDAANTARPPPQASQYRPLDMDRQQKPGAEATGDVHLQLFQALDRDFLFPDQQHLLDCRPSSSRSHVRHWHRNKSPVPNDSKYMRMRVSSEASSLEPNSLPSMPMTMTREEFEALPPTIQRKYFSTLERLRFAVDPNPVQSLDPLNAAHEQPLHRPSSSHRILKRRRHHKANASDTNVLSARRHAPRISSIDQEFYANLPDKIKRRHLSEEEQLAALRRRKSVILDAADEALVKIWRRQSRDLLTDCEPLPSPSFSDDRTYAPSMQSYQSDQQASVTDSKMDGSFQDSFRWLEEEDELDLRLFLDDYHINLRDEVPLPSKSRRPSFRRHLSINKLPFGRPSVSNSRPVTKDTMTSTSPTLAQSPLPGSPGHTRRKSRALSLISPIRQQPPSSAPSIDPGAAHYQDPEARMKLRVYLASPQKFDEAIEFGFPSMDGVQAHEDKAGGRSESRQAMVDDSEKLRTFLEDDRSSLYSDGASVADPESPRTPETCVDKLPPNRPFRVSTEPLMPPRADYLQAPASSREMTLRMTLTRPDLRADEDQIYGWTSSGRKTHHREESAPVAYAYGREGSSKDSIEKQLASLDQCHCNPSDNGVVKRIWNKVRRS